MADAERELEGLLALARGAEPPPLAARRYLKREPETETSRRLRELVGD